MRKLDLINAKLNRFGNFIGNKLKNYPHLSLGEQIAYACVGLGILLILASIVLSIL